MKDAAKFMEKLVGPMTIAMKLGAYRTGHDMTLEEMAAKLGTSKGYVSNILTGKKKLSLKKTMEIAEVLELSKESFAITWFREQARDAGVDFKKLQKLLAS